MHTTNRFVRGGFLGAGQSTTMLALARRLTADGHTVGIITNDQTDNLVDTQLAEQIGATVEEVTGSCFCCNYPTFAEKISQLRHCDYILAEPVGSCTDLASTIMRPTQQGRAGEIRLFPLTVLIEPQRLEALIADTDLSLGIHYIMDKQLEEADFILLNKVDTLTNDAQSQMLDTLCNHYPKATVMAISAQIGDGLQDWLAAVTAADSALSGNKQIDVIYETYGKAEADMGWLNARGTIQSNDAIDGNSLIYDLSEAIRDTLSKHQKLIGHLKIALKTDIGLSKLSCVNTAEPSAFDEKLNTSVTQGELTINLRALEEPEALRDTAESALKVACEKAGANVNGLIIDAFKPGFPNPTYRL